MGFDIHQHAVLYFTGGCYPEDSALAYFLIAASNVGHWMHHSGRCPTQLAQLKKCVQVLRVAEK